MTTTAEAPYLQATFRVRLKSPSFWAGSRPTHGRIPGKLFFAPRRSAMIEVGRELQIGGDVVPTTRAGRVLFVKPEEAAAMEPGDLIAFPTFPTDVQRLARNVAREISAHGAAQEFRPVRVVEVADETYTHPADAPLDSAHLERGETYVKVYFEFFEPTLEELEEAGGFRERP